jgi:PAS domain S-box-containing protein
MVNSQIKILAIDDKKDDLAVLKDMVSTLYPDVKFFEAESGKSGYDLCQIEKPDVVLLNTVMPEMNGYEVCSKLKSTERMSQIPVIMIIANRNDSESRIKSLEAGADAFLSKPVEESELKAQISAMLRIKKSEDIKKAERENLENMVLDRTEALEIELTDRKKAENKLIQSLDKLTRNRQAILNLMEDLKTEMNEKRKVEASLQNERNLLRTLVDNLPDTIYILDKEGRKVMANKADLRNIGCESEDEVIGKSDLDLFPVEIGRRGHADNLSVIKSEIPIIDREEYFIDHSGIKRWLLTSKYPLYDSNGEINGLFGTGHEITERKKAVEDLIKAKDKAEESDRLKTAFLHNISHEIRTPMNAITGFSALLHEPGVDTETQHSFIDIINQSSNHLLNIVTDIIEISNIEAGLLSFNKKEINLNAILKKLTDEFIERASIKGIEFKYEIGLDENLSIIQMDSDKLNRIFLNLLNNAFKFTAKGLIKIGYRHKAGFLEFYVSDTGIGIPHDQQKRIFERFYQVESTLTRNYEGIGLGLPISKAYIELMGGRIWLESEPGSGSVFYFTIPYIQSLRAETVKMGITENKKNISNGKKTILIAEDEENNYLLLKEFLSSLDVELIHATNGKEAVDICVSSKAVSLVLMDIKMPVMDGYTATCEIRKLYPDLPVVALTAYSFEDDRKKAISCGCNDFLSKPFSKNNILKTVTKYLFD